MREGREEGGEEGHAAVQSMNLVLLVHTHHLLLGCMCTSLSLSFHTTCQHLLPFYLLLLLSCPRPCSYSFLPPPPPLLNVVLLWLPVLSGSWRRLLYQQLGKREEGKKGGERVGVAGRPLSCFLLPSLFPSIHPPLPSLPPFAPEPKETRGTCFVSLSHSLLPSVPPPPQRRQQQKPSGGTSGAVNPHARLLANNRDLGTRVPGSGVLWVRRQTQKTTTDPQN